MANLTDKNLQIIEMELTFLRRHIQNILTEDFNSIDVADLAIRSALQSLEEYRLNRHTAPEQLATRDMLTT